VKLRLQVASEQAGHRLNKAASGRNAGGVERNEMTARVFGRKQWVDLREAVGKKRKKVTESKKTAPGTSAPETAQGWREGTAENQKRKEGERELGTGDSEDASDCDQRNTSETTGGPPPGPHHETQETGWWRAASVVVDVAGKEGCVVTLPRINKTFQAFSITAQTTKCGVRQDGMVGSRESEETLGVANVFPEKGGH